jgi:hypothetical protein
MTTEPAHHDKPPFIADQGMRLLTELRNPKRFLMPEAFRGRRTARENPMGGAEETDDAWSPVDRDAVALDALQDEHGQHVSLHRLVVTSDAGTGKTTTMDWMRWRIADDGRQRVAFLILLCGTIPETAEGLLDQVLAPQLCRAVHRKELGRTVHHPVVPALRDRTDNPGPNDPTANRPARRVANLEQRASQLVRRLRQHGRLVLLFDALDQADGKGRAVRLLQDLLGDPRWDRCRIVLSGRPHALQRYRDDLFVPPRVGWRYVLVDDFREKQSRVFLGKDRNGKDRYDRLAADAREILTVPRVLNYLRQLTDGQLSAVRTPSDVYCDATRRLIRKGLASAGARRLGETRDEG